MVFYMSEISELVSVKNKVDKNRKNSMGLLDKSNTAIARVWLTDFDHCDSKAVLP